MNNQILKRITKEQALQLLNENPDTLFLINQATAATFLNRTRQRIKQLVSHPEHALTLGVETTENGKILLNLRKVLQFNGRNEFRGKRGPQKKSNTDGPLEQSAA